MTLLAEHARLRSRPYGDQTSNCSGLHRLRRQIDSDLAVSITLSAHRAPAVFDGYPCPPVPARASDLVEWDNPKPLNQISKLALSTWTPGPMVDETVILRRYTPLDALGFDFCKSPMSAWRFSLKAATSKLAVPMLQ